jgi:hypothetical protein
MSCHPTPTGLTPFSLPTESEIATVTSVIRDAGHFPAEARLTYVGLLDPVRGTVAEVDRRLPCPRPRQVRRHRPRHRRLRDPHGRSRPSPRSTPPPTASSRSWRRSSSSSRRSSPPTRTGRPDLEKRGLAVERGARGAPVRRCLRVPRRVGKADPARAGLPPAARDGFRVGAPDRRARRLCRRHEQVRRPDPRPRGPSRCPPSTATTPIRS